MADRPDDGAPVTKDPVVTEARARFLRCAEAEDAQRKRIVAAKAFRAGDQWPAEIKLQRQGSAALQGQAAQPPRPCLTIDRLSQPVRQVSNQIKQANFAIDVVPNGNGSDVETATIFKGYIRRVQNQARGDSPIEWAADQAVEGGIGWFRLRTEYVDEAGTLDDADPAIFDQELRMERLVNNLTVYCDPQAVKPTRADAQFMFVTEEISKDEAKRKYDLDEDDLRSLDDFMATGDDKKGWVTQDTIRIAEYWRIEYGKRSVTIGDKTREISTPKVLMSRINAVKVLADYEWVGSRIPLIPVLGEELNVDGKILMRGLIEEGMDAQRMVNYMYSAAIETVALAPKAPLIVAEGQVEDYKQIWQNANRFNYAYLPYKPTSLVGHPVPPPVRDNTEPAIQAMAFMLDKSEEAIKATTGIYDPTLGRETAREKSGRAIQALQSQGDLGSSNYPDNVMRALIYAGELMVEVIPKITRPGQLLSILGVDDKPEQVIAGQAFVPSKDGQQPQPVPPDQEQVALAKGLAKFYDLSKGRYGVTVTVGKSYTTKREEGAAALGELLPHLPPEMAAPIFPEYIEQLSFPGAHKIAETARKALPPQFQEQPDQEDVPPAVQQKMMMLSQQLEQTTKFAQDLHEQLTTKQIEQQGKLADTQMKEQAATERTVAELASQDRRTAAEIDAKMKAEALNNLVKLAIAEISAQGVQASEHGEMARTALGFEHEHEQRERDRAVQRAEGEAGRTAEAREGAAGRSASADEAERARQAAAVSAEEERAFAADQAERDRLTGGESA